MFSFQRATVMPGSGFRFDFPLPIDSYVLGISYFRLGFPQAGGGHSVKDMSLKVSGLPILPSAIVGSVEATLNDSAGHSLSASESIVVVSCMVSYGETQTDIGNQADVLINPSLPESPAEYDGYAFISGFEFKRQTDYQFRQLWLAPELTKYGIDGRPIGVWRFAPYIVLDPGYAEPHPILDAGCVMPEKSVSNLPRDVVVPVSPETRVDLGIPLVDAIAFLRHINVVFDDYSAHNLLAVGGGCTAWDVDGSSVVVRGCGCFVEDASGHTAATDSSISLAVFATPK